MRPTLAILLFATLTACSVSAGLVPATTEQPYDFFGAVQSFELDGSYSTEPAGWRAGQPGGGSMRIGPAWLVLSDGERLRVPAETPGGNACEGLYDPMSMDLGSAEEMEPWVELEGVPKPDVCVVIGELLDEGTIRWFEVLPEYNPARSTVTVGGAVSFHDDAALSGEGYRFPVSTDLSIDCGAGVTSLGEVVEMDLFHKLEVDAVTGQIVAVECLSRE